MLIKKISVMFVKLLCSCGNPSHLFTNVGPVITTGQNGNTRTRSESKICYSSILSINLSGVRPQQNLIKEINSHNNIIILISC